MPRLYILLEKRENELKKKELGLPENQLGNMSPVHQLQQHVMGI